MVSKHPAQSSIAAQDERNQPMLIEFAASPFLIFRCPVMSLRFLNPAWRPSAMGFFIACFFLYFFVISGAVYNYSEEPPFMGHTRDASTGTPQPRYCKASTHFVDFAVSFLLWAVVPQVFMRRLNAQYSGEGLAAGMLFCAGGLGFIFLDMSQSQRLANKNQRHLLTLSGLLLVLGAYSLTQLFIRSKIPSYLAQPL